MGTIASLDIDAQKGFTPLCPNELPVAGGDDIVAALNAQAALATLRVGSKDAHPANAAWVVSEPAAMLQPLTLPNADLTWPAHCVPGTLGFELLDGLPAPIDYDFFVWKGVEPDLHPYGACYHDLAERRSTGLVEFLQARGVSTVLVGGLATDYCVKTSVLQLLRAGFRVIVHLDACRGIAPETIAQARAQMIEAGAELAQTLADVQRLLDA
ncbi:nicotinamidase [Aeromonas taiwanensis]|uniref:nicotinamidase n=1 Tax=Aeromonas taiwanensis TaxID=633417 RepID=A0A5F0KGP5_9GAMM|nr:nicotinamidase [Aeromonas taiwanensis]TFF81232.1 nicotinamidase [Aeromonas taiwanensis]TFF82176.1 nicotinamidase [Aeromonas taiwanensis]TFF83487.1 nicotinamidase [Aeromonas taiwanensis]